MFYLSIAPRLNNADNSKHAVSVAYCALMQVLQLRDMVVIQLQLTAFTRTAGKYAFL